MHSGFDSGSSSGGTGANYLSLLEKARCIVFSGLFQIKQSIVGAERTFYVTTLIMTLQMLYMPILLHAVGNSHHVLVDLVEPGLRILSFGFQSFSGDVAVLAVFGIAAIFAIVMLVGTILLGYDEMHSAHRYKFLAPVVDVVFKLSQTVFQIPFTVFLLRVIRCDFNFNSSVLLCHEASFIAVQTLAALVLAIHFCCTVIYALVVHHHSPYQNKKRNIKLFAAPHGRVESFTTTVRGVCTILFVILAPQVHKFHEGPTNVLAAVVLVCASTIVFAYAYYLPFYNVKWNVFSVACYTLVAWGAICAIVANSIPNRDDNSAFLLLTVPTVFICFTAVSLTYHRVERLKKTSANLLLQSAYLTETRLRLIHQDFNDEVFAFQREAEKGYRQALESFPDNPFLGLYISMIATATSNRMIFALNLLTIVRKSQLPFDLDFALFCHNKLNAKSHSSSKGSVSFIALDQHLAEARKSLITTLKFTSNFWKKVTHGNCTLNQILLQGAKVHEESSKCRFHLTRLRKLSRSNREGLRLYSLYYMYVMNDKDTAMALERELNNTTHDEGHGSAVATISGTMSSIGQILEVSDAMCSLFGYSKGELLGRNVSMLCPSPFMEIHDLFLKQFVTTDSEFAVQTRRIHGMHAKGHVMATDFEITPSTNSNSELVLIGRFKKVQQPEGTYTLLVDGKSGFITSFTLGSPLVVGFEDSDVFAMNLHITDVLVDFFDEQSSETIYRNETNVTIHDNMFKVKSRRLEFSNKDGSTVEFHVAVELVTFQILHDTPFGGPAGSIAGKSRVSAIPPPSKVIGQIEENESEVSSGESSDSDAAAANSDSEHQHDEDSLPVDPEEKEKNDSTGKDEGKWKGPSKKVEPENRSVASSSNKFQTRIGRGRIPGDASSASGSQLARRRGGRSSGASQASSSFMSGTVTAKDLEISQVHRRVMRKLQRKDPNLLRFGVFARRFVFFFILFTVADTVVLIRLFEAFLDTTINVEASHQGAYLLVTASLATMMHRFSPFQVNDTAYERVLTGPEALLLSTASEMKFMHELIVDEIESSGNATMLGFLNDPLIRSTFNGISFRNLSFHVSYLEIISHIENHVREDNLECGNSCHYILNNAPYETFETLEDISEGVRDNAIGQLERLHLFNVVVIGVVSGILVIFFVKGYLPMFLSNDRRKKQVGDAFLAIPATICKKLLQRTERRLVQMQSQQETDLQEEAEEDLEEIDEANPDISGVPTQEEKGSSFRATSPAASREGSSVLRLPETIKSKPKGFASVKVAPARRSGKDTVVPDKRRIKKVPMTLHCFQTLAKNFHVGLTFWTVLAFFVINAVLDTNNELALHEQNSIVYAAGQRYVAASLLHFWATYPLIPEETDERRSDLEDRLHRFEHLYNLTLEVDLGLKYGNEALGIPPFTETRGDMYNLLYDDACDEECEAYIVNSSNCRYGLQHLRHGLSLMFEHWLQTIKGIMDAEKAYLHDPIEEKLIQVEKAKLAVLNLDPHLIFTSRLSETMSIELSLEHEQVQSLKSMKIIATVILVVALIFSHFLSLSAFAKMDSELKKAQAALLLLPLETFVQVPALIDLLNEE